MNRRTFINNIAIGGTSLTVHPDFFKYFKTIDSPIRLALIGKGGMGTADTNTALRIPGVELVAVCDIFNNRLDEAKQQWGNHIQLENDYIKLLSSDGIDAVIIATPDHWHQKIAIEALRNGKHVYCEKPIVHKRSEATALIKAQQLSGKIFQMGTQGVSAVGTRIAKEIVESGLIGPINFVDARFSAPPSPLNGFRPPVGATKENIWWDRFLGDAPKHPFDAQRFFAWRNWSDYGTGLAGDLFVHVIASVHYITGSSRPKRVYADGDILYYKDGSRDTPDVIYSLFDYENDSKTQHFKMSLGANVLDGVSNDWGSTNFQIIGNNGSMRVTWDTVDVKLLNAATLDKLEARLNVIPGFGTISKVSDKEYHFSAQTNYVDAHYLHFKDFFDAVRSGQKNVADVAFGVHASTAALMSFESQLKSKVV